MYLVSTAAQDVHLGGHTFAFAAGETIHTESSHKYRLAPFERAARDAGFRTRGRWTDSRQWFAVWYFEGA
jgi:uncharacterized SAM-dependent methyltransferase